MYIYIYVYVIIMILPCAKDFYPNAFARQRAKTKVIIQDVAE